MRPPVPFLALAVLAVASDLRAQDPFEIQVYEVETVPKGKWDLETHVNYVSKGTTAYEGPMAPTEGQFHTAFELTRGITDNFELAGYLLLGSYRGANFQYAGMRIRPRVSVPKEWEWPVGVSFSVEFGFPVKVFEENGATLEIRPILEKKFGDWQMDINPVVGTALSGPGKGEWDFEPGVRLAYEVSKGLDLSVEYYGSIPFSGGDQVHQVYPGADIHVTPDVVLNVGAGWGLTDSGNRFVWKVRLGVEF